MTEWLNACRQHVITLDCTLTQNIVMFACTFVCICIMMGNRLVDEHKHTLTQSSTSNKFQSV